MNCISCNRAEEACQCRWFPAEVEAKPALTRRQAEVLLWVAAFIDQHGYQPSYRQIAAAFKWASSSAVFMRLLPIEKKGYLRRGGGGQARAITILAIPQYVEAE